MNVIVGLIKFVSVVIKIIKRKYKKVYDLVVGIGVMRELHLVYISVAGERV